MAANERLSIDEAKEIVYGDREQTYGHPSINLERIASMWSVIFGHPVTPRQVCQAMIALKLARDVNAPKHDNVVDMIGYAALIDRIEEGS